MSIRLINSNSKSDEFQLLNVRLIFANALWYDCNEISIYDVLLFFFRAYYLIGARLKKEGIIIRVIRSLGIRRPVRSPGIQYTSRLDSKDYFSDIAMRLCDYSSRIVSLLDIGMHSPLLNMLPLRIFIWVPQDSVYLVINPSVTHSRMPRPRYTFFASLFTLFFALLSAIVVSLSIKKIEKRYDL